MKSTTRISAIAALLSIASYASAGTFTITSGPNFTPEESFTNNSIQAEVISNPSDVLGDLVRISGNATITPPVTDTATIDLAGSYSADPGDKISLAYLFTADLNSVNPVQYTISGTVDVPVIGTVPFSTSGTITNGLHVYTATMDLDATFPVPFSGNFTAMLTLEFAEPTTPSAASGTLDLAIQQIDIQLAPSSATLPPPSESLNISTRGDVQTGDNVLIGGFIITGTDSKQIVLRAIGPSLTGVAGALADPVLELHDPDGAIIATNDNWMDNSAEDQTVITDNGLDQYGGGTISDLESVLVQTLDPAAYTAIVRGVNETTGVGLVEVYDLDSNTNGKLANISTRGFISTGDDVLIGGFILGPDTHGATIVVVRAIGPSLVDNGVPDALLDPTLDVFNQDGDVIASNDNWADSPDAQTIADAGLDPNDDNESALLVAPQPGQYTAIVSGVGDTTGVGLVEMYNLPPGSD